jgi:hypothetical protein
MVVEIGRKDSRAVVHVVVVFWWGCSWAVLHVVVVEVGAWWIRVVDVRPVDGSCYVVAVLHVVITALVVVH